MARCGEPLEYGEPARHTTRCGELIEYGEPARHVARYGGPSRHAAGCGELLKRVNRSNREEMSCGGRPAFA